MPPLSRLQQLLQHLNPDRAVGEPGQLSTQDCAARGHALPRFDVEFLEEYLDEYKDLKKEIYEEHRELVRKTLKALLADGHKPMTYYSTDLKKYFYFGELMALVDLSLTIKMGVQYSLWGGSIYNLGTERHKQKYLDDVDSFKLPGGFAMTELRHGSNVAALQTEAVLDPATDEWVVTTPDDGAIKWWIGNAAEDGRMASVFARLKVPASDGSGAMDDHGVHAFIVPLRDAEGNAAPGVEIRDCGYKVGLQGVDNGSLRFSGARIPRENLLDRFGTVDSTGQYRSPFSMNRRFAATLGELTGGRVGLCCSSLAVLKGSVTIAIRYGATRQQFGPPDAPEVSVLDYTSQQQKLMPMLSKAYALHFATRFLVTQYAESKQTKADDLVADVHALSAGLKAYITEYTANSISVCRAACGGHGYAAANRFGAWRSDHDIFQTFEGDNCVLLQQVAGLLLKKYAEKFKGAPLQATYAYLRSWATDNLPANPLVSHETKVSHLRDAAFLSRALKYRVARLLHTVALRLRKHTQRKGAFQAWNRCLGHLLALARAHIESVIYTRLSAGVSGCSDPDARKSLKAMADIFALGCIQSDVMFRNDDYIAAEKVKAINKLVEDLCRELRAMAVPLVDAFAIPDHILRAPIGLSSYLKDPYAEYLSSIGWSPPLTGATPT